MTYLQFHLLFNLPAILFAWWLCRDRLRPAHLWCLAAVCVFAFLAAAPWDIAAIHRGIWGFDWARCTPIEFVLVGVRWRVPAEECAFFILEAILVGLVTIRLLPRAGA